MFGFSLFIIGIVLIVGLIILVNMISQEETKNGR